MRQKVNFIQQPEVTSSVWKEAPKHFPKSNLYQKKVMVSLVVSCQSDSLQLSESWKNHYIWEICTATDEMHWKLQHLQPALVNRNGLILLHDNARTHVTQPHFKTWMKWTRIFCFICHIPLTSCQLTITFQATFCLKKSCLKTFCRENASTTSRRQKMISKSSLNPEAQIFTLKE